MDKHLVKKGINDAEKIQRLRDEIKDYRPGDWTIRDAGDDFKKPSKVVLGVFGVQDSGKSAFLNCLHFAYKGYWNQVYIEGCRQRQGGETIHRDPTKVTNHVTTIDTRGLRDLAERRVQDVLDEITGNRGIDPSSYGIGEKIDCPIFVLRYNTATGIVHSRDFISSLVPEIREEFGSYPIMVVTFADSILNRAEIVDHVTRLGMDENSLFFIENYTASNHEMDCEKHIDLLEILKACIARADDNITFRWRQKKMAQETKPPTYSQNEGCKIM